MQVHAGGVDDRQLVPDRRADVAARPLLAGLDRRCGGDDALSHA
jgi:hypothetical protein